VPALGQIDLLNKCRHRGALTGASGTTHQNEAVGVVYELAKVRVQIQPLNRDLRRSEQPHGKADTTRRLENVNPAADATDASRQIERAAFEKMRPLIGADNPACCLNQVLGSNRLAGGPERTTNA